MASRKPRPLGTLAIALLVCIGSAWILSNSRGVFCDQLAPLTVLAMLAAVVVALGIRQLALRQHPILPAICLGLALISLVADVRFVLKYRALCGSLHLQTPPASNN